MAQIEGEVNDNCDEFPEVSKRHAEAQCDKLLVGTYDCGANLGKFGRPCIFTVQNDHYGRLLPLIQHFQSFLVMLRAQWSENRGPLHIWGTGTNMAANMYSDRRITTPLHSFDEFTPLRSIIVGSPFGANHPQIDPSFEHFFQPPADVKLRTEAMGPIPKAVIDEVEEDILAFVSVLLSRGIEVHRPEPYDSTVPVQTPFWASTQLYSLMPRDSLLVFGDLFIESASPMRARYFETFPFRSIMHAYERRGATIVSAPKPMLVDDVETDISANVITDRELLFDAANCVRFGRDIFVDVNRTANRRAVSWLSKMLRGLVDDRVRVHPMSLGNDHVDVTLIPLRPGVLLVDPVKVKDSNIPEPLRHWKRVAVDEVMPTRDYGLPYPLASNDGIGRNVLVLGSDTVIVDDIQLPLIRELERLGLQVIPLQYRHGRTLGGSWHCITLDTVREGGLEDWVGSAKTLQKSGLSESRYAEAFRRRGIDTVCGIDVEALGEDSHSFLRSSTPSVQLLEGIDREQLRNYRAVSAEDRSSVWKALLAEYDAEAFCKELERRVESEGLILSPEFREFETLWRRDELDHTLGFITVFRLLYDEEQGPIQGQLQARRGDFDRLRPFLSDEFSICLLLAYDELVTTISYAADWKNFYPQFRCEQLLQWIKRVASDEARHYRNLVHLIRNFHSDRLTSAAGILDAIMRVDLQRSAYAGTFVLDHDDVEVFPADVLLQCRNRIERDITLNIRI